MSTPFHLSSWIRTIRDTHFFKPILSIYLNRSGSVAGLFPYFVISSLFGGSRIVSIPFSDYCTPLTYDSKIEKALLEDIVDRNKNKIKYIEVRGPLLGDPGYLCHNIYFRDLLELDPDPLKVYQNFDKRTVKYSIRKAERAGVQIKEDNSPEGVSEFYRLYKLTRKKHGVPCQPKTFFENIAEYMISQGLAFIILATYRSKVISASMFFKLNKILYYKYNVSDPAYLSSITPNHLLAWYVVRQACLGGYHILDFGRTSKNNKGLIRYKRM